MYFPQINLLQSLAPIHFSRQYTAHFVDLHRNQIAVNSASLLFKFSLRTKRLSPSFRPFLQPSSKDDASFEILRKATVFFVWKFFKIFSWCFPWGSSVHVTKPILLISVSYIQLAQKFQIQRGKNFVVENSAFCKEQIIWRAMFPRQARFWYWRIEKPNRAEHENSQQY